MKGLAVLGSTGSIGTQTLSVVREKKEDFYVTLLSAYENDILLEEQIREFKPEMAVIIDEEAYKRLKQHYKGKTEILVGEEALVRAMHHAKVDIVVMAIMGFAGLRPTLEAIEAGKDIALANKETLVVAGELVMRKAREKGIKILPIDSEHSAIFQCLQGEDINTVYKLWLTASGGPFRKMEKAALHDVSVQECLNHPTWSMGKKITVDSATLINKGFEVIEAHFLYGIDYDDIAVVVHPESIVHSMVEFIDGAIIAQLGSADMKTPIQYALTYPKRKAGNAYRLDFSTRSSLHFEKPRTDVFRGLGLAYEIGKEGGVKPCILNAANEVAVSSFLRSELSFLGIYEVIEKTLSAAKKRENKPLSLEILVCEDNWARKYAKDLIALGKIS